MKEKVLEMASALGRTEAGDESLETLCAAAVEELTARLRPGVAPADCGEAFILAAAWMALAQRELGASAGGVERFTAGAVTIQRGDANARREALLLQARQVMRPWLRDEGFSFRGVRG